MSLVSSTPAAMPARASTSNASKLPYSRSKRERGAVGAYSNRTTRARSARGDAMSALRDLPPLAHADADQHLDAGRWGNGDAAFGIAD
jgi:hypothetical protein